MPGQSWWNRVVTYVKKQYEIPAPGSQSQPTTSVQILIQQQRAAWEGAEAVYIEVPMIQLAFVKAVRVTDNGIEVNLTIDGETCTISGKSDCLDASAQHVACPAAGWIMYFHPDIVSRVRAADATCRLGDGQLVEKFKSVYSIIRETRLPLPYGAS